MPARRFDVILFDLDGTISDSAPGILNCIDYAMADFEVDVPTHEQMRSFLGPPLAVTFREHFGLTEAQVSQAIVKYRERYHDVGLFENTVYDGIPELLIQLNQAGYRLATATSKPEYSATRILQHFELDQHFEFLGGAALDGSRDSKALVIAHTLEQTHTHPTTHSMIMVGDRSHDVHGARDHGIDTIGVLWGYGDQAELDQAGAIGTAQSIAGLKKLLEQLP